MKIRHGPATVRSPEGTKAVRKRALFKSLGNREDGARELRVRRPARIVNATYVDLGRCWNMARSRYPHGVPPDRSKLGEPSTGGP